MYKKAHFWSVKSIYIKDCFCLKVRVRYYTNTWSNGAAVDDIELYGLRPLATALNWTGVPLPDVFTDAATTLPYTAGTPASIVYVKPNLTQLENDSYTFTATATLTNGCNVSQNITINNKSTTRAFRY